MRNRYFLVTSFPGQRRDWRRVGVGGCLSLFSRGNGHFSEIFRLLPRSLFSTFPRVSPRSLCGLLASLSAASSLLFTAFPGLFTASGAILHVTASGSFLHGLSGPSLPVSAAFLHVMASGAFLHGLQGLFSATFPRISSRPLGSAPGGDYFFSAFLSAA